MPDAPLILPLDSPDPALELVGGKARGLAMLIQAALAVPPGFCITTRAFTRFLHADASLTNSTAAAGAREQILHAPMPEEISAAIIAAYAGLSADHEALPVAVRSSATVEDLPGLSFAGQQDSFLNVTGEAALLEAVRCCWASLYAERAISYRQRMGVATDDMAMAVVVQRLVPADAAGVLFTANPGTGARSEIVINASLGLGEAVVAGIVTADTWVLDRDTLQVRERAISSKVERIRPAAAGGTERQAVPEAQRTAPALSDRELISLARLGLRAEAAAGGIPQDIEWVLAEGRCLLVQSRPITNLPEPIMQVEWQPPAGATRLFRRQVVENMSLPLSPLFDELYLGEGLDRGMDRLMESIGLPMRLDDFVHRPMFVSVNGYGYCRYDIKFGWHLLAMMPKILFFYVARLPGLIRTLITRWEDEGLPEYQQVIKQWRSLDAGSASNSTLIAGIRTLAHADARYWGYITMMVGAAKISEAMLAGFLSSRLVPGTLTAGAFLRGFPSRTLAARESLAGLARSMNADLRERLLDAPGDFLTTLGGSEQALAFRAALDRHLADYGQQIFDLDFIEPTLSEQPEVVVASLRSLAALEVSQARPATAAIAAEREALTLSTASSLGRVRKWLFHKLLRWAQTYAPYREAALFHMGAAWPTLRHLALTLGDRLVAAGSLTARDDVFFLTTAELADAGERDTPDDRRQALRRLARDRRALREARKRLHPPGRVPPDARFRVGPLDVTRFFEIWETQKRNPTGSTHLTGFPVSPGRITGPACVVRSAADFHKMHPGAVLVCPSTTPAWTPLFEDAVGLVTDIGAVLAHGSIVAREYGIPAVMGTGNATQRIADGDQLTVDGDRGRVTLSGGLGSV